MGARSLVVIGQDRQVIPLPKAPGALLFVDGRTGKTLRRIVTPSAPVDVVVHDGV